jgi:16S rRNA (guanine1207-N2)-methyltransferase
MLKPKDVPKYGRESYFEAIPTIPSKPQQVSYYVDENKISLQSDRGAFSYKKVDTGTKVLLKVALDPVIPGDLLDLGCGYGPISIALALKYPDRKIWAVDVNERARELLKKNANQMGLKNIIVAKPDDVSVLSFAAIYSNPPIRIGKAKAQDLLITWLARLDRKGSAYFVIKKNLGADSMAAFLQESGYSTAKLSSKQGYRVFEVKK